MSLYWRWFSVLKKWNILIHTIVIMNNNRKKCHWSQLLMLILYIHTREICLQHVSTAMGQCQVIHKITIH
jgi:hypothetical protein